LTIAIGVLLLVALDAGPNGGQASFDSTATGGRRWMPMPSFPPGASVTLLLGDPVREAGYMDVRFPAGHEPPLHPHMATERIDVVEAPSFYTCGIETESANPEVRTSS
jgi:hypothetical protein